MRRQAFSLLELMIVILIMSFSYMLVFSSMRHEQSKPKALNMKNLKENLARQGLLYSNAELFCLDRCKQCYLYKDGETIEYKEDLALGDLTVYQVDSSDKLTKIDFGRYQDHPVCLRFSLYHNGSSSQLVVQNKTGIYYLPALFAKVVKTDSLEEAEKLWLKDTHILADSGEFY